MGCYYTGANNGSNCYELYDKVTLLPERELINDTINEVINSLGQKIDYWVNTYNVLSADNFYGEQPTSVYNGPHRLKMYIELNENALTMSRFGFAADDEITTYITYTTYTTLMSGSGVYTLLNQAIEPKSGDIFNLVEYGNDRPGNRGANYFQVTERMDQDIAALNPLGGHYMWRLKGKRLEYSFEPGLSGERGNDQVYDNTFTGKLSSSIVGELSTVGKVYPENADNDSRTLVYDMSAINTDVYGDYY